MFGDWRPYTENLASFCHLIRETGPLTVRALADHLDCMNGNSYLHPSLSGCCELLRAVDRSVGAGLVLAEPEWPGLADAHFAVVTEESRASDVERIVLRYNQETQKTLHAFSLSLTELAQLRHEPLCINPQYNWRYVSAETYGGDVQGDRV